MNRRHFLKAFTGGVVGAGVMIAAPKIAPFDAMRAQMNGYLLTDFPNIYPAFNPDVHVWGPGLQELREIQRQMNEGLKLVSQHFYASTGHRTWRDRTWRVLPE